MKNRNKYLDERKKKALALSANNRGFVPTSKDRSEEAPIQYNQNQLLIHGNDIFNPLSSENEVRINDQSGFFCTSLNQHIISDQAPEDFDNAVDFFNRRLHQFTFERAPLEFGMLHYNLMKIYVQEKQNMNDDIISYNRKALEYRLELLDKGLYHLSQSLKTFEYDSYPSTYSILQLITAQIYRQQIYLLFHVNFPLKRKSNILTLIEIGLRILTEIIPIFQRFKSLQLIPFCCCCYELGSLYKIQSELYRQSLSSDESVTHLDIPYHYCY
jgi:hypothetical protein